ncbi:Ras GTPase ras2 [Xylographa soralifera]|nr:Ras GTPase ras2 [Xylographa soralifera]
MAVRPPEYRVLVLGAAHVGKTGLVRQFICNHFSTEYDPTGEEYRKMTTVDGSNCIVEVDEIGSEQNENSELFEHYIRCVEAFVLVYSVVERASFESVRTLMADIEKVRESTKYVPVVLVGNKIDSTTPREVSTEEGNALAQAIGALLVEVSAKESTNVDEAFHFAVRLIKRQREVTQEAEHRSPAADGNKANGRGHKHRRCKIL